ncbi:hypothetical protein M413DRAFT_14317 [Hebeloma cylindrosporum]|uniref:F-box domain-containing protein n=1 Tax=Hebeloma cylindrosporum TaxID=76867 RepID=A0A0C2Y431_HEBCY|nr:hypothetical protein M413DRAFT_14317 [Hebeloma cylindrosporum h7]
MSLVFFIVFGILVCAKLLPRLTHSSLLSSGKSIDWALAPIQRGLGESGTQHLVLVTPLQLTSSKSESGGSSNEEIVRLADLRVADLRESIRALNCHRNDHIPIAKLPVEVVTEIFLIHQQNCRNCETVKNPLCLRYKKTVVSLAWIGVTHVYRRWREIALNFPGLWVRIPFHNRKWAEKMESRCHPSFPVVSATCYSDVPKPEAQRLKKFLKKHLSRVQVLDFDHSSPRSIANLFQNHLEPTSVPHLSTLRLLTAWSSNLDLLQIVNSRLLNTVSLRELEFPTTFRWDLSLFNGLTHLKLVNGSISDQTKASHREFLDALRRMPTLQCLHLNGPFLPEAPDASSLEPVHLPNLRDLLVYDTVYIIDFFLRHVNFPPATRTTIHCRYEGLDFQLAHISPILPPLKEILKNRPQDRKLHHIKYNDFPTSGRVGLSFQGWISSDHTAGLEGGESNADFPSSTPDFTFSVEQCYLESLENSNQLAMGIFELLPQDDIFSFSIDGHVRHISCVVLARKLAQLPMLKALSLGHINSAPIVVELAKVRQPDDDSSPQWSMATFPALQYLDFTGFHFQDTHLDLTTLYNCLKKRSEHGLGPGRLRVNLERLGYAYEDTEIELLLEELVEVVWIRDIETSHRTLNAHSDSEDSPEDWDFGCGPDCFYCNGFLAHP